MTTFGDFDFGITPHVLLKAYACGIFPMAESATDNALYWIDPQERGTLPLDGFHVPRRLARTVRSGTYRVTVDTSFAKVIHLCGQPAPGRENTWINERIYNLYTALHAMGHCHSIEVWRDGRLAGGLYGVRLGGAFFGESMFSRERDASKVALVHLVARLKAGGFTLLDTQFVTAHLARFGAVEISRADFADRLEKALAVQGDFFALPACGADAAACGRSVLQVLSQTS